MGEKIVVGFKGWPNFFSFFPVTFCLNPRKVLGLDPGGIFLSSFPKCFAGIFFGEREILRVFQGESGF